MISEKLKKILEIQSQSNIYLACNNEVYELEKINNYNGDIVLVSTKKCHCKKITSLIRKENENGND